MSSFGYTSGGSPIFTGARNKASGGGTGTKRLPCSVPDCPHHTTKNQARNNGYVCHQCGGPLGGLSRDQEAARNEHQRQSRLEALLGDDNALTILSMAILEGENQLGWFRKWTAEGLANHPHEGCDDPHGACPRCVFEAEKMSVEGLRELLREVLG